MDKEVARFVLLKGIKWWVAMGLSAPCSMLIEIKASRREESAELLIRKGGRDYRDCSLVENNLNDLNMNLNN
jgi:hypothetical protein